MSAAALALDRSNTTELHKTAAAAAASTFSMKEKESSIARKESLIEEKQCPICYEQVRRMERMEEGMIADGDSLLLVSVEGCTHEFCRTCLEQHCIQCISDKSLPIFCPAAPVCENVVSTEQVHQILCKSTTNHEWDKCDSSDTFQRYRRFLQLQSDPSLVACPRCDSLVSASSLIDGDPDTNGGAKEKPTNHPSVSCHSCGHEFCFQHGDLHPGMDCDEYRQTLRFQQAQKLDRKSRKTICKTTKPCSHCQAPIYLEKGCDHVVCPACRNDFCYKCGTHIYLSGDGTVRYCANCRQGYIDHRQIAKHRCCVCLQVPCWFPCCLIYSTIAMLACLLSCGFGFAFCCGKLLKQKTVAPIRGIKLMLGVVLLAVVDVLEKCGIGCLDGLLHDFPGQEERRQDQERAWTTTAPTDNADDDDDGDIPV